MHRWSPDFNRFTDRFRRQLIAVRRKLNGLRTYLKPQSRGFASQRMCPFCGLDHAPFETFVFGMRSVAQRSSAAEERYTRMIATIIFEEHEGAESGDALGLDRNLLIGTRTRCLETEVF